MSRSLVNEADIGNNTSSKIILSVIVVASVFVFWGKLMAIKYNNLWKTLIDKGINKTELRKRAGISSSTMAKMTNGEAVSLTTIERICAILECSITDVVEISISKNTTHLS